MNLFNRIVALIWGVAGSIIGYTAVVIALGPKGDAAGWIMVTVFAFNLLGDGLRDALDPKQQGKA